MMRHQAALRTGYAAYKSGDLERARSVLEPVHDPQAFHLLGLVERRAGNLTKAANWLDKAAAADRHNHEIANNQGRVALDTGNGAGAEQYFRRALALRPGWRAALSGLGASLNKQTKWADAEPVWEQLLRLAPDDKGAQYGAAMAALETGRAEQAETVYTRMVENGVRDPAVYFMRGRARLQSGNVVDCLTDLKTAWADAPQVHTLRFLANVLWMCGDKTGFDALLHSVPDPLALVAVDLIGQSGDPEKALAVWHNLADRQKTNVQAHTIKAVLHRDLDQAAQSLKAAELACEYDHNDNFAADALTGARLMNGDVHGALDVIIPRRKARPNDQIWLAHETTALRMAGDARYDHLVQTDRHVRAYTLPVPQGFHSITDFNRAFMAALEPLYVFKNHPLGQSLRSGIQTARSLTTVSDPVIRAYFKALDVPIRAYLDEIGRDQHHPLTKRNSGHYRFKGCWSVRLMGGGWHVNHVHGEGWISSAYYVSVPEACGMNSAKAGWIKFGAPPFATDPVLAPQKWIRPEAGLLVLFPSYLWHGTHPIEHNACRVTAPFDIVPA